MRILKFFRAVALCNLNLLNGCFPFVFCKNCLLIINLLCLIPLSDLNEIMSISYKVCAIVSPTILNIPRTHHLSHAVQNR